MDGIDDFAKPSNVYVALAVLHVCDPTRQAGRGPGGCRAPYRRRLLIHLGTAVHDGQLCSRSTGFAAFDMNLRESGMTSAVRTEANRGVFESLRACMQRECGLGIRPKSRIELRFNNSRNRVRRVAGGRRSGVQQHLAHRSVTTRGVVLRGTVTTLVDRRYRGIL